MTNRNTLIMSELCSGNAVEHFLVLNCATEMLRGRENGETNIMIMYCCVSEML